LIGVKIFFIEYVLGYTTYSSKAAEAGNFIHKSMEILALIKKAKQDGKSQIDELGMGSFIVNDYNLDDIFKKSCDFYLKKSPNIYIEKDFKIYRNWFTKALEYKSGLYNPINREIVGVEKSFDITFEDDWAKYEYELHEEKYIGQYSIKGNVDIIIKESKNILELIDYKTGARKDWLTGKKKEYNDFLKDPQLLIYYYALAHLYPDKDIIISIFYINDGGVFSVPFDRTRLPSIKDMLRKRFEKIKTTKLPKLLSPSRKDFKCYRLCHAYKTMVGDKTLCEYIHNEIRLKGIHKATEDNIKKGFDFRAYADGGGSTGLKEKDLK